MEIKYDVFISYSRNDYVKNGKIIPDNPISMVLDLFGKNGISYWFDKDGVKSGRFTKKISKAIANSKMLLFVSSAQSNKSVYTCGEILKAQKSGKLIIPFLIEKCEYNEDFDVLLLPLQHIDFVSRSDTALMELLHAVNEEKEKLAKTGATGNSDEDNLDKLETVKTSRELSEQIGIVCLEKNDYKEATLHLTGKSSKINTNEEKSLGITRLHDHRIKEILTRILTSYGKTICVVFLATILLMLISWLISVQQERGLSVIDTHSHCLDTVQSMCDETKDIICIPIDLGLSSGTLWGDKNVGAKTNRDNGCLYAWGETIQKREYTDNNYGVRSIAFSSIKSTKLDVANVSLGDGWSLPTEQQFKELMDSCTWVWIENDTMNGYRVIGPNNHEIFFPANGCADGYLSKANEFGYYWTCELSKQHPDEPRGGLAKEMWFNKSRRDIGEGLRYRGQGIRAVKQSVLY